MVEGRMDFSPLPSGRGMLVLALVVFSLPSFVLGICCDELVRRNPYELKLRVKQAADGGTQTE